MPSLRQLCRRLPLGTVISFPLISRSGPLLGSLLAASAGALVYVGGAYTFFLRSKRRTGGTACSLWLQGCRGAHHHSIKT